MTQAGLIKSLRPDPIRTARLFRLAGNLLMLGALVLPIALPQPRDAVTALLEKTLQKTQPPPAPPVATLEEARRIIPGNLQKIYRALDDGNPAAASGLISDQLLGNITALDTICRPYTYRAHYLETIIERPGEQFEAYVHELSKPLDEVVYVLLFRPFQSQFVLVDVLDSRGAEWLQAEKQAAGSIARQFIFAAAAGKREVVQRLASPGLNIAPFFDESDYATRVRNVGSIVDGPGLGVIQVSGRKIRVYYTTGRREFCGDLWELLVDRIEGEPKIVAWKFEPMAGCYRLGQWPTENMTEDPDLETYTLERFGIHRAVPAIAKPDTQRFRNGTEELEKKTASSEEAGSSSGSVTPQRTQVPESVMRPLLIEGQSPTYPDVPEQPGINGTVVLQAEISKSGAVEEVRLVSGNQALARAAIDAVKRWRYKPYTENGQPVDVETEITLPFAQKFSSVHR